MSSTAIKSVSVATEATFASIDPATGIPSAAGLSWSSAELADDASVTIPGDPVLIELTSGRAGIGRRPAEPATLLSGGVPIQRRTGTVQVSVLLRPGMDATPTSALWKLLRTLGVAILPPTIGGHSDVTIAPVDADSWTATTAAKYADGAIVGFGLGGRWDYAGVEDVVGGIGVTPALQSNPGAGATARIMATVGLPGVGLPAVGAVDTVALDLRGDGWQAIAFGCAATQAVISVDATTRRATLTIDYDSAHIAYQAAPAAPVQCVPSSGGTLAHQLQSYVKLGATHADDGTPDTLAGEVATTLCLSAMELTLALTRAYGACGSNITGRSYAEVTDATVSAVLTLGGVLNAPGSAAGVDADLWRRYSRQVLIGFASGEPGTEHNGFAIWMPSTCLTADPAKLDSGETAYRQVLTLGLSVPAADSQGGTLPAVAFGVGV